LRDPNYGRIVPRSREGPVASRKLNLRHFPECKSQPPRPSPVNGCSRGKVLYTPSVAPCSFSRMPIISNLMFQLLRIASRKGLREESTISNETEKMKARRTGVRGESYAYWFLRKNGYVFVARNYMPHGIKGEIDLVGYDGKTLAFVEVRTRTVREKMSGLPELSVSREKQHVVIRSAKMFLAERRVPECPCRFDVVAIDNLPGRPPAVRLHKDAFAWAN
jgi:putative endonuclease